jgi:type I restriction enzyme M protein
LSSHTEENPLKSEDLKDCITCYNPVNCHKRKESDNAEKNPESRISESSREDVASKMLPKKNWI